MGIETVIMPWGKFRGELIEDLPSDYLWWLAENCADEHICNTASDLYGWRSDNNEHWYE